MLILNKLLQEFIFFIHENRASGTDRRGLIVVV